MSVIKNTFIRSKRLLIDMKYGFGKIVTYELLIKALISVFLFPVFRIVVNFLMGSAGFYSLTNFQVLKYAMSIQGFATFILIFILAALIILIEIGGLIYISNDLYLGNQLNSITKVLRMSLSKFKNIFTLGGLLIILYFFIFTPYIEAGITTSIVNSIKIPDFIKSYISNNMFLKGTLTLLKGLIFIYTIKWIFAVHFIILEDKKASQAIKESWILIKNNFKLFIKSIVELIIIITLIALAILLAYIIVIFIIFTLIETFYNNTDTLLITLFTSSFSLLLIVLSLILIPIQIHSLTIMYYNLTGQSTKEVKLLNNARKYTKKGKVKMTLILFSVLIFITLYTFVTYLYLYELETLKYDYKITAHRGNVMDAPENTLSAITASVERGADYVEIDVQQTKDGQFVLFHDSNLKRITGLNKAIWEVTYEEIKDLDAGSWFDEGYASERIPLLEDVVEQSKGKIRLNIEIKIHGYEKDYAKNLAKLLETKKIIDSCVVTSLDYDILQEIENLNPDIKTGYVMIVAFGDLNNLNVDFFSVEESQITEDFIFTAHYIGKEVHAWTVNDRESILRLANLGINNIITDDLITAKDVLNEDTTSLELHLEEIFSNIL